ncbi:MAG: single-stranded-DNA-specific exonuclease RecJ [Beijerinckiaceae bacterium]|nr:single-stranded-DNA-specific exonuclease RecJ [Beijerinckiaceae bacterium]
MNESPLFTRAYLGVERSALGQRWHGRLDPAGEVRALAISQIHGTSDILSRVLAGRGVTAAAAKDYLDPSLQTLMPDPHCLKDMERAASRIATAIQCGETIAILGDYDVDGAAASALLHDYFRACGAPCLIHIPDRIFEGYGPNSAAVRKLGEGGATLLITVDCGTLSYGPLEEAIKLGINSIVLDHHNANENLPNAIVVNPNRHDDLSGLGYLCAAGVVFLTLIAVRRALREIGFFCAARPEPDLLAGLDLVALATVADVAPLTGLNRAFVAKGLALMRARGRPGLTALCDIAGLSAPPTPYHLGFLLGPRINAGGRIGDAALGARLLTIEDSTEAKYIAQELDRLNRERQELERTTLAEAELELHANPVTPNSAIIAVTGRGWHPGVAGLVASRLKEKFRRPAFAIAFNEDGTGTGSGRSIAGVDLGRAVCEAAEAGLLIKGGGHAMAAGLTISFDRLNDFKSFLDDRLAAPVAAARADESLLIDAALSAGSATPDLMASLARGGPYGAGNPEPVIALPAHRLVETTDVGNGHVRLRAIAGDGAKIDGIAFRAAGEPLGRALHAARGNLVHLAGTLAARSNSGKERIQLRLADLAPSAAPYNPAGRT